MFDDCLLSQGKVVRNINSHKKVFRTKKHLQHKVSKFKNFFHVCSFLDENVLFKFYPSRPKVSILNRLMLQRVDSCENNPTGEKNLNPTVNTRKVNKH